MLWLRLVLAVIQSSRSGRSRLGRRGDSAGDSAGESHSASPGPGRSSGEDEERRRHRSSSGGQTFSLSFFYCT